ncbi:golgin subfamily A member 6-like protein 7 [Palaemon carinicauda]|uniref:golgin subfamily A member 6-like protein 7 n=1 Tax=Palaemon carinicauda TaxID=392227 RepID=UPI0035B5BD19
MKDQLQTKINCMEKEMEMKDQLQSKINCIGKEMENERPITGQEQLYGKGDGKCKTNYRPRLIVLERRWKMKDQLQAKNNCMGKEMENTKINCIGKEMENERPITGQEQMYGKGDGKCKTNYRPRLIVLERRWKMKDKLQSKNKCMGKEMENTKINCIGKEMENERPITVQEQMYGKGDGKCKTNYRPRLIVLERRWKMKDQLQAKNKCMGKEMENEMENERQIAVQEQMYGKGDGKCKTNYRPRLIVLERRWKMKDQLQAKNNCMGKEMENTKINCIGKEMENERQITVQEQMYGKGDGKCKTNYRPRLIVLERRWKMNDQLQAKNNCMGKEMENERKITGQEQLYGKGDGKCKINYRPRLIVLERRWKMKDQLQSKNKCMGKEMENVRPITDQD